MNKAEFIKAIAEKSDLTQEDAGKALDAMTLTITEQLKNNSTVQLIGFGTFKTTERAARTGRNPQTGEEIQISAATIAQFKPGAALKDAVNS